MHPDGADVVRQARALRERLMTRRVTSLDDVTDDVLLLLDMITRLAVAEGR